MKRKTGTQNMNRNPELAARVGRALIRAGESARRTARMYGTPLYVWEKGRVVAKRPRYGGVRVVERGQAL